MQRQIGAVLATTVLIANASFAAAGTHAESRQRMVKEIEQIATHTGAQTGRAAFGERVLEVLGALPRHEFVPEKMKPLAYENRPLPIGHGQTISQPYIVALMTDLLDLEPGDVVLEVGTGSAYQAAVLAELVDKVYTIEIVEPLADQARARLKRLGYPNVSVRLGDGYYGWEERGPFDAIIVTAAASHVPPPLVAQLATGGKMIIPVGGQFTVQQLVLIEKRHDGQVVVRQVLPVRFVPLTGGHD